MKYKVIVYVPVEEADNIRQVMGQAGGGRIGDYDFCSFSVRGVGRFRPLKGANPTIGEVGKLEEVDEERIEIVVEEKFLKDLLEKVEAAHPYEQPAIDVVEVHEV